MFRYRLLAVLAVLPAFTQLAPAQSSDGPEVFLGAPVATLPATFGRPTTEAALKIPRPRANVPQPVRAAAQPQLLPVAAQPPVVTPPIVSVAPVPVAPAPMPVSAAPVLASMNPAWFQVDYLMWWARGGPTGGPLVTTGGDGALGAPGTRVLLGNQPMGYGPFAGVRIAGGLPLDDFLSVEAGYFYLGQRTFGFRAGSDLNGNPLLARPVINAQAGAQEAYAISVPGALKGSIAVESQIRMDGYEFNLGANVARSQSLRFDVLGGFRALDMSERLAIRDRLVPLVDGFLGFNGVTLPAGSIETDFDTFATTNHFYGGQVGGRLGWQSGRFSVTAVAKVALGVTQQSVDIAGQSEAFVLGNSPATVQGGILAQPSNIGHYYRSTFSVVPETGLQLGYQITPWLRATVGYTLIYWTNVARPGNQTDRTVNPALVPTDQSFGLGGGPARPVLPAVRESDFWVQGVNFGLVLTY